MRIKIKDSLQSRLEAERDTMESIGFTEAKVDLCVADIRRGALLVVDCAREAIAECESPKELLNSLEKWCGIESLKRKQ